MRRLAQSDMFAIATTISSVAVECSWRLLKPRVNTQGKVLWAKRLEEKVLVSEVWKVRDR